MMVLHMNGRRRIEDREQEVEHCGRDLSVSHLYCCSLSLAVVGRKMVQGGQLSEWEASLESAEFPRNSVRIYEQWDGRNGDVAVSEVSQRVVSLLSCPPL
jgi:hypothetical protein